LNILRGEPEFKSILEIARLRHESFKTGFLLEYVSLCPSVVTWCSFPTSTFFRLAFLMGLAAAAPMGPVNMLAIRRGVIGGWHTLACGIGSITGHLILFSLILLVGDYLFPDLANPTLQTVLAAIGAIVLLPLGIVFHPGLPTCWRRPQLILNGLGNKLP
jgi:hypothetical protein